MSNTTYYLKESYLKRVETPNTYGGVGKIIGLLALFSGIAAWILANGWFLLSFAILCIVMAVIFIHDDYVKEYESIENTYSVPTVFRHYKNNPIYARAYNEMIKTIENDSYSQKYWYDVFTKMNAEIKEFDDKMRNERIKSSTPAVDYAEQLKKSHQLYLGNLE